VAKVCGRFGAAGVGAGGAANGVLAGRAGIAAFGGTGASQAA
jgi:hypothetical protein